MAYDINITLSATRILIAGDGYTVGFKGDEIKEARGYQTVPGPSGTLAIWEVILDLVDPTKEPFVIQLRYVVTPSTWRNSEAGAQQAVDDISAIIAACCSSGGSCLLDVNVLFESMVVASATGLDPCVDNTLNVVLT